MAQVVAARRRPGKWYGEQIIHKLLSAVAAEHSWVQKPGLDHGISIFMTKASNSSIKVMGKGEIPHSVAIVKETLLQLESLPQWDWKCKKVTKIATIDAHTSAFHTEYSSNPFFPDLDFPSFLSVLRDFCVTYSDATLLDGTFIFACTDADHCCDFVIPPSPFGSYRGKCVLSGWLVEPTQDGKHSKVTFLVEVDGNGGGATFPSIVKYSLQHLPLRVHYLREHISKKIQASI